MAAKKTTARRDNKTGSIYKDGNGYRVQVLLGYDPATGKPQVRKARASTHADAVETLQRLQNMAYSGKLGPAKEGNLETFLTHWLEYAIKPNRAPKTHQQYAYVLKSHVIPTLGKKKLDQVKRPDVQRLASALLKQPVQARAKNPKQLPTNTLSRRTVAVTVAILHSAFEDAIRDGLAASNPAEYIQLPQALKKPPQFLNPEDAAKLFAKLEDSPVRELIRFMLVTGTRLGEAKGIRWQDLDLKNKAVRITGQLQRIDGKLVYRPTTKTNQDRKLPIPEFIANELQELKSRQMVEGWEDPDALVFLNPYGRRLDDKYVYNCLREACKSVEIPLVSPHKLRHTAATLMLAESGDLHGVQKMLGHQQVALTSDLYGHATTESLRSLSDGLGRSMRLGRPN
jgi:integrase